MSSCCQGSARGRAGQRPGGKIRFREGAADEKRDAPGGKLPRGNLPERLSPAGGSPVPGKGLRPRKGDAPGGKRPRGNLQEKLSLGRGKARFREGSAASKRGRSRREVPPGETLAERLSPAGGRPGSWEESATPQKGATPGGKRPGGNLPERLYPAGGRPDFGEGSAAEKEGGIPGGKRPGGNPRGKALFRTGKPPPPKTVPPQKTPGRNKKPFPRGDRLPFFRPGKAVFLHCFSFWALPAPAVFPHFSSFGFTIK